MHLLFESPVPPKEFKEWLLLIRKWKGNLHLQDVSGKTAVQTIANDTQSLKNFLNGLYPFIPTGCYSIFLCKESLNDLRSDPNITLLHLAIFRQAFGLIELFIGSGFDINSKYRGGFTVLNYACNWLNESCYVEYLVRLGADVNTRDDELNNPLHWTAKRSSLDCSSVLLRLGADINAINKDGDKSIIYFARHTV